MSSNKIVKVWFADGRLYGLTEDGQQKWQSLLYYSCLMDATDEQRLRYEIGRFGIRWPELDEDVSHESFYYPDPEPKGLSRVLLTIRELNLSAVARRLGIPQSLLAAYRAGTKKPSKARELEILAKLKTIGESVKDIADNAINEISHEY